MGAQLSTVMWYRFIIWWRGWDENDILSAQAKLDEKRLPGSAIEMTNREMAALPEMLRRDRMKKE